MTTTLTFHADPIELGPADGWLVIGRRKRLLDADVRALLPQAARETFVRMVKGTDGGDNGRISTSWFEGRPHQVQVGVLPEPCSRHNSPSRAWAVQRLVSAAVAKGSLAIVAVLDEDAHAFATACAIAQCFPTWTAASRVRERAVSVALLGPNGFITRLDGVRTAASAVRRAAHHVDMAPGERPVSDLVEAAREVAARLEGVTIQVIRGRELEDRGLGGLWNVGKAATDPPALVVLEHVPAQASGSIAWVGKGIVYDTGGLSIKAKTSMPGMKSDMAGAAAVLAAFEAAVSMGVSQRLTAALCIAENAVGPTALRPDDVITLYSGRTVEVNNTDAEGRLVLADGVAWVARHHEPDEIVDLATLTGAQSIATGKLHAGVVASHDEIEARAVDAGRRSGDLVHPLPYAPELFRREFHSPVADMRNSVKDRGNAQSSCAALFIQEHLAEPLPWLHVDMAGPAFRNGRATGYGVALLLTLVGVGA